MEVTDPENFPERGRENSFESLEREQTLSGVQLGSISSPGSNELLPFEPPQQPRSPSIDSEEPEERRLGWELSNHS